MWDVVVVGAGPGGSLAAKKCVEQGFKTLMVEKKKLPRDKVCSGMVAGPWAMDVIQMEFGEIPREILVPPRYLSGQIFHVPGVAAETLEWRTLLSWRKDLDFWLTGKALEKGAVLWDGVRVMGASSGRGSCTVRLEKGRKQQDITASYVVGADGAGSVVRKSLFPELKVKYSIPIRECYDGPLDMDRRYLHWFFPKSRPRPRFNVNFKGDAVLVEGSGLKELRHEISGVLAPYGWDPGRKPLWRDGCMVPQLHKALISRDFRPARGNALLIGDAAGLLFPITFEGIGAAFKSARFAVDAISEAAVSCRGAASIYLGKLDPVLDLIQQFCLLDSRLETAADGGPENLCKALTVAYKATLRTNSF
jgi:flavin-dependent dehydrogenase